MVKTPPLLFIAIIIIAVCILVACDAFVANPAQRHGAYLRLPRMDSSYRRGNNHKHPAAPCIRHFRTLGSKEKEEAKHRDSSCAVSQKEGDDADNTGRVRSNALMPPRERKPKDDRAKRLLSEIVKGLRTPIVGVRLPVTLAMGIFVCLTNWWPRRIVLFLEKKNWSAVAAALLTVGGLCGALLCMAYEEELRERKSEREELRERKNEREVKREERKHNREEKRKCDLDQLFKKRIDLLLKHGGGRADAGFEEALRTVDIRIEQLDPGLAKKLNGKIRTKASATGEAFRMMNMEMEKLDRCLLNQLKEVGRRMDGTLDNVQRNLLCIFQLGCFFFVFAGIKAVLRIIEIHSWIEDLDPVSS